MLPLQKRSGNTLYHTYRNHDTCVLISDASCPAELALESLCSQRRPGMAVLGALYSARHRR